MLDTSVSGYTMCIFEKLNQVKFIEYAVKMWF